MSDYPSYMRGRALSAFFRAFSRVAAANIAANSRIAVAQINAEAKLKNTVIRETLRQQKAMPQIPTPELKALFDTAVERVGRMPTEEEYSEMERRNALYVQEFQAVKRMQGGYNLTPAARQSTIHWLFEPWLLIFRSGKR